MGARVIVRVEDDATGALLACFAFHGDLRSTMELAATAGGFAGREHAGQLDGAAGPVAGRIDAAPSDLDGAITGWLADLEARRRSRATVAQYRAEVRRAAKESGWARASDVTAASLSEYMASAASRWKTGTTYNRALCCLRSWTRYLVASGRLAADPLAGAARAAEDGGEGARAATLEEARAMIAYARERELTDGRARGHRSLYYQLLFGMGMRDCEPARLEWQRHMFLDEAVPYILFTKDINKNKRLQEVPVPAETLDLLLAHREEMRRLARTTPVVERTHPDTGEVTRRAVSPDDPAGMVFPRVPPRATFRKDRDACGIPPKDRRGRPFTTHSARKFYETLMVDAGLEQGVVDRLMRHAGGIGARYYDADLRKLSAAAAAVPKLWPDADLRTSGGGRPYVDNFTGSQPTPQVALKAGRNTTNVSAEASTTPTHDSSRPPSPGAQWSMPHITAPPWLGGQAELTEPASLAGPPRGSSRVSNPGMPILGSINADRTALAGLFEALARLLREPAHGSSHGPDRQASA